jgi:DNA mismatch repair protein MutL
MQPDSRPLSAPARAVQRLPDALVDQIAAGEVVERPASVVKELVENALDAGATRIRVDVREGGASLIAVTDDGRGMPQGDARLALQRHATSKIRSVEELQEIGSFGFRGEALPSIASVSRLRLVTREHDAPEGWELNVDGGELTRERAVGCAAGTRVEVADLFASVPARRKFLKRPATEWGHIKDWIGRLALALPGVHFELRHDDRPAMVWPATSDPLTRIAAVVGEESASKLVAASFEGPEGHVEAYLSGPEHARSNGNGLYLFVNGRPVRDPVLRHALLDAYRDLLPRGRFPTAVLFLTVPPDSIDVNVHPAKWEVRFADPRAIHRLVRHCVREAMSARRWLGPATPGDAVSAGFRPAPGFETEPSRAEEPAPGVARPPRPDLQGGFVHQPELSGATRVAETPAPDTGADPSARSERISFGSLRVVGQLLASYLLVETKQGLVLVDQHAAHERILYERLRAQWLDHGVSSQPLLVAETVEIEALALAALVDAAERCARLGFDLEPFGEDAVLVRAVPALLSGRNPAALVRGLARELQDPDLGGAGGEGERSDTRLLGAADRIFATLACHAARRFGDHLPPGEQQAILRGLDEIPWAPTCPHGRPVAVALDVAEIERRFGRR